MSTIYNPTNLSVNTSSLFGQLSLKRTESALSNSIRNLSSGIRIHSGRDDPIGFVSSTAMRTDIVSMSQAVSNCQRANSILTTTDSALSHMNSLLNDLRGLITQAANTGGENSATLAALQLEADAIIDTIDFISNSTALQDRNLIDGSLDFTTYGVDRDKISYLEINQANFLGRTEKDISVQVLQTPRQAELYYPLGALKDDVVLNVGGTQGYQTFTFDKDASVRDIADAVNRFSDATGVGASVYSTSTPGTLALTSYGKDDDIILTAGETGREAGNFVVKYTASKEGNDTLSLKVNEGSGNEPTEIEVVLQTETWKKAEYHYNGANDGISNNEFTISARYAGSELNDVEFVFDNVFGTDRQPGIEVDLNNTPKQFRINVSYDESNPESPSNTTVADLERWIRESPVAGTYFELTHSPPSDGSGPLLPDSGINQTVNGTDGGAVLSTAEQVATLINNSSLLKDDNGVGRVTASLPSGSLGMGTVSPFAEVAYYGDPAESNYLQFLAPENAPSIQFVSTPGTPLSIDDTTYPPVYANATAKIQGLDSGTSFTIKSLVPGPDGDQVGVILRDSQEESAVFDAERNAVVISVDFTGRAEDPDRDDFSMNDLKRMFDSDPFLGSRFAVEASSAYDPEDPPRFSNEGYIGIDARVGETAGGIVSQGTVLIHLETDTNGVVKTTANDLVRFFDDPSSEQAQEVLDRLGISVSNIDPSHPNQAVCVQGLSSSGTGVLKPTYDPNDCVDTEGLHPNVVFSSYGSELEAGYPTATVLSQNGIDSEFTITARQAGATMNNTNVRITSDTSGPNVAYNATTKTLTVGVPPNAPTTANEIIDLINSDPQIGAIFVASRGAYSTGEGVVATGDQATLTGGVKQLDERAQGTVVSSGGVDAMFEVLAKRTDGQYDGTEIQIVSDSGGPKVSYDPVSKQLTIGIDPVNPSTANEIVELINNTQGVSELFEASIPAFASSTDVVPTGEGLLQIGDRAVLRSASGGMMLGAGMLGAEDGTGLGITFHSIEYGSNEFVSVLASLGTDFPLTDRFGNVVEKTYGTDVVAKIDGQQALGTGRVASTSTSDLELSIWLDPSVQQGDVFGFRIDGGGMLVQLGPDPVSSHQARIGIKNTHSVSLGGVNGFLSQLRSGGEYDLLTDTSQAFKIVEEVSDQISGLRGRLGAFQKYRVQTNMENLVDAIEIETGAMSEIKDADFASESSELLRQQVLMQSNIAVLQQSGQAAQMLLGLLQR